MLWLNSFSEKNSLKNSEDIDLINKFKIFLFLFLFLISFVTIGGLINLIFQNIIALILYILIVIFIVMLIRKRYTNFFHALTENTFIVLTSLSSLIVISFVIYILTYIFIIGSQHITWEFLTSNPTEGLTSGGIFPAIVGTAFLVIIMSIAGIPIGTITAIYITEYAKENSLFSKIVRFSVNSLAGVPPIIFGLFGLGFFIGIVGKQIDNREINSRYDNIKTILLRSDSPFYKDNNANPKEVISYIKASGEELLVEKIEILEGLKLKGENQSHNLEFYIEYLKEREKPKWGQPALIWAALTMALFTLPLVIISVEEAIKSIPPELKEASYSLGATKLQTIIKVVLPGAVNGIFTGGILAVSRGAGEVAPILFTGVAMYLPELPDSLSSQFMELGYHIYVLATQSINVELTKPIQYATTFVLLVLTFTLNFTAIFIRAKTRNKFSRET